MTGQSRRRGVRGVTSERGAGSVLVLIVMMVLLVAACVAVCGVSWVRCAHSARSVADLAALAGARALADGADACAAARVTATSNGATLTGCLPTASGDRPLVKVDVGVPVRPHLPGGPETFTGTATAGRT